MSPLYDLILQRKGELQTETMQVGMALQLSHPIAAKRGASERPGMELRLESRALNEAIDATAQFLKTQRVVACCGDRFTLAFLC